MIEGLLGRKIGMTQVFSQAGVAIPVTVIELGPCVVTQIRNQDADGYEAVQIGFGEIKPKSLTKPEQGHLAKAGRLDSMAILVACLILLITSETLAQDAETVLFAGLAGLVTYLAVNGLGTFFENAEHPDEEPKHDVDHEPATAAGRNTKLVKAAGKAGFFLFLYLEVLDASFSFDGVIGAFAITSDPILIALGLGLIGAMFVRSLTVFLVRKGTLSEYIYLEHGAHWAIGALALILFVSIGVHISEFITGLLGVGFIGAALWSSIRRNQRLRARGEEVGTIHA